MILVTESGAGAEGSRYLNPDQIESIETLGGSTIVTTTSGRQHHVKEGKTDIAKMIALWRKGPQTSYAVQWFGEPKWTR